MCFEKAIKKGKQPACTTVCPTGAIKFGDRDALIREARKRDGLAVGIASDEVRRHGLNPDKRTRLIKAGAHLIIPDFSDRASLFDALLG